MKLPIAMILLAFTTHAAAASDPVADAKAYPYGNPVIRHMYTADAAPHVMPDGRVWMVTSVDHEQGGGYSTMHRYHSFSSADMVNWVDHGEVLHLDDVLAGAPEPDGEDWALWAPDMVYHQGQYWLYFPVRILYTEFGYAESSRKTRSYIAVAVSDAPDRRFRVVEPRMPGTRGIDPAVFVDDDGQPYLYYGAHLAAKLKENMVELDGEPVRLEIDDPRFMEASWMHKRGDRYYFSYHAHYGKPVDPDKPDDPARDKSVLHYGMGDSPLGPFRPMGVMNHELGVGIEDGPKLPGHDYVPWRLHQSNHGGIVEFHGRDYLFYHNSALSSWRQHEFRAPGSWTQRSVCVDYLDYGDDGAKIPVRQTLQGVAAVVVDQPFEIRLGPGDVHRGVELGSGYYYFGVKAVSGPGRIEVRLDAPDGHLAGTVVARAGAPAETFLRGASGTRDVYLVRHGDVEFTQARFFAGAPLPRH